MTSEEKAREPFASWGRLEIMGHLRFDGFIEEVDLFGTTMVAVDPLDDDGTMAPRRYFGASSVYSLSPCTEDEIRTMIEQRRAWAARRQQVMRPPQLEEAADDGDDHTQAGEADDEADDEAGEEGAWP